jgi:hypothetical protein
MQVQKVVDLVVMHGAEAHAGKTILSERLGIDCGSSIRPNNYLTPEEKEQLIKAAHVAGVIEAPTQAKITV